MPDELSTRFSALSPGRKAAFLARVAHESTIDARATAYGEDYRTPDGARLREFNEFIHRVTGYIPHVLDGSEGEGQDASVMAMIVEFYASLKKGREGRLAAWLEK